MGGERGDYPQGIPLIAIEVTGPVHFALTLFNTGVEIGNNDNWE